MLVAALVAGFDMSAQSGRAAVLNGSQHLALRGGRAVRCQVLVAMFPKHIGYFEPMSRVMVSATAPSRLFALVVGDQQIQRTLDLADELGGNVRVDGGGSRAGMAQQFLDHAQLGAGFQQMRRKAMT